MTRYFVVFLYDMALGIRVLWLQEKTLYCCIFFNYLLFWISTTPLSQSPNHLPLFFKLTNRIIWRQKIGKKYSSNNLQRDKKGSLCLSLFIFLQKGQRNWRKPCLLNKFIIGGPLLSSHPVLLKNHYRALGLAHVFLA